ncbi:DNA gyrase subunit A [Candidatus Woesearchaeota archaeon]|nr:DNA gyrase subunit A [Candidatus Woesearchaeota archaeon]
METKEKIVEKVIDDEMKQAYLGYSMSVIVSRALPDVKDGLKPVHRRILYAMFSEGLLHNKKFSKCAGVVGEVLKKYHPHGDSSVYDALVRLAQPWNLRYPLIQGQGNFGSMDGDSAAAYRYTESRLKKIAEEMLADIDKDTVEFVENFDGTTTEPLYLPAKIPNLLINGSSGIAVGMATNMPPHNLSEVCDGAVKLIDDPDLSVKELMKTIKGPDFPTGAIIAVSEGLVEAYETGKGKITLRAKYEVEEKKKKTKIIISEVPYQVNPLKLQEEIAELVREKKITGISNVRDETGRNQKGLRLVIELKSAANADVIMNQLFKHTRLQDSFSINALALVDGQPKVLNLKQIVQLFIDHRKEVITRRTKYELKQAEDRAHILEGLIIALDHIDEIIEFLKKSKSAKEAKEGLMSDYKLSDKQAQAILDMRLQRLTGLEQEKIRQEYTDVKKLIEKLKGILASAQKVLDIIKKELEDIKASYGDERRTQILKGSVEKFDIEELIKPEDMVITITHAGYIKRIGVDEYKQQRRGGKGVIGAETKESDFLEKIFVANTHDYVLFFTSLGKVHWVKVYEIPEAKRYAKGTPLVNLIPLGQGENIAAYIPVSVFEEDVFLLFATQRGYVKKTALSHFSKPRKGGIRALTIPLDDRLIAVLPIVAGQEVFLATSKGQAIRFKESDVRPMGRAARGVIGIKLKQDDHVVGATVVDHDETILTVTKKGYGKRTSPKEYRSINRGGVGVINIKVTDKNGPVICVRSVKPKDQIMLITQKGTVIRTRVKEISVIGRNTQGVRTIRLQDDRVVDCARIVEDESAEPDK